MREMLSAIQLKRVVRDEAQRMCFLMQEMSSAIQVAIHINLSWGVFLLRREAKAKLRDSMFMRQIDKEQGQHL